MKLAYRCKTILLLWLAALLLFGALPAKAAQKSISRSIVKIYVVSGDYNYYSPWQMRGQSNSTGSGAIISGNRILTNAHVISNSTFIQVKRADMAKKYTAYVEQASHASDLAILKVKNSEFFRGTNPLALGDLPEIRNKVTVYGFPTGGNELSITEGVVSRIEHRYYSHSNSYLLTAQIDAAINPGNSGGPVLDNGKIVGVAFQVHSSGDNIGYMVPAPIVKHFMQDVKDGDYGGIPTLGISVQKMENPDIRARFALPRHDTGISVRDVLYGSPAARVLRQDDIIVQIEGVDVANNGSVEFSDGKRTYLSYYVQKKQIGEQVDLKVWRDKEYKDLSVRLTKRMHSLRLVPYEQYNRPPTYYIIGGLVFIPLSKNFLKEWGGKWYDKAPKRLLYPYYYGKRSAEREQVIVMIKVLADQLNAGYHKLNNLVITKVNGHEVGSMAELIHAFESHKGDYHRIVEERNNVIILDRQKVERYNQRILKRYQIPHDRSRDLR